MNKIIQNKIFFYSMIAILIALYAYLTLCAPISRTTPPQFQLTTIYSIILKISFTALVGLTWFFGALAIRRGFVFAGKIKEEGFRKFLFDLSLGLSILVFGYMLATFVGQIRSYNPDNLMVIRMVTIAVNYIYVLTQFFGFYFLYKGVSFYKTQQKIDAHSKNIVVGIVITLIIGSLWVWLIFTNTTRQVSTVMNINPSFFINDFLIVFTIIIPTLFGWFFGIMASLGLADLSIESPNIYFQKAFSKLVSGVWLLILSFVVLFGILSISVQRLLNLGLAGVLVIVYVFILIILWAYGYTALSLKNLEKSKEKELNSYDS